MFWKTSLKYVPCFVDHTGQRASSCMQYTIYIVATKEHSSFSPPPTLSLFSPLLKNLRTSRAFDIQEKRGSAVNSPPNIQGSGSLLDKHRGSESDLEPTETSWKSHKIFTSLSHSSVLAQFAQGAKICIFSHFTGMCWPIPPFLLVQTATCCES